MANRCRATRHSEFCLAEPLDRLDLGVLVDDPYLRDARSNVNELDRQCNAVVWIQHVPVVDQDSANIHTVDGQQQWLAHERRQRFTVAHIGGDTQAQPGFQFVVLVSHALARVAPR